MIHNNLLLILSLLFVSSILVMLGNRLRIAYPIFLVIGGLLLSLIPGIPPISIDPAVVFLIFLPPLLYEAAWFTSWKDFSKWWRAISLMAFGLVFLTSLIVAYVANSMIPGFTLALGFLLGGIISPPDAVAATSILRHIKVPKRLVSVLEGESLINDASSLIVFRFALAAIMTGQFGFKQAFLQFIIAATMGIVIGIGIGFFMYMIHRKLPTTPGINVLLTLMSPYLMYITAEQFHFSGVMAVVSGGLFLSFRSHEFLKDGVTRLHATGVWNTLVFVLNMLVFILIGLQLRSVISGLGDYSIGQSILYGLVITLIAIVVRILWVLPIAYVPKWIHSVRMDKVNPAWKGPVIIGWAGMRGVVSLASALSIPVLLSSGEAFPHRNLILFITFIVILITLVFQGLTLPWVIRKVDIKEMDETMPEEEQDSGIRLRMMRAALKTLDEKYGEEIKEIELVGILKKQLENEISTTDEQLASLECDTCEKEEVDTYNKILIDLIGVQRRELFHMRREKVFDDESIRHHEAQLDLEEAKLNV